MGTWNGRREDRSPALRGRLIECRQHLRASAWANDVTALVLRARRGGTLWRRMPRLCERCRNDAAN